MSESQETFDQIGRDHREIYNAILKRAWEISGHMVVGMRTVVDGKYVPSEYIVLDEIKEACRKKV
jgi:hypothetical protein